MHEEGQAQLAGCGQKGKPEAALGPAAPAQTGTPRVSYLSASSVGVFNGDEVLERLLTSYSPRMVRWPVCRKYLTQQSVSK